MYKIRFLGCGGDLPLLPRLVAWAMRLAVAGTFIFSGFTKAVDPYGTLYKLSDYVAILGWHLPEELLLIGAFLLFTTEFVIGAMLALGCFRRASALSAMVIMAVMLPLSVWLVVANPVADCGCFGDALLISNWATLWKNIALAAACVWLLYFNRTIHWVITPALQWLALIFAIALPIAVGFLGYLVQPPIDFRAYKLGVELLSEQESEAEDNIRLIYADPQGKEHKFSLTDALPTAIGWRFLRQELLDASKHHKQSELRIYDAEEEEVTSSVITDKGEQLILFMPRLEEEIAIRDAWSINALYRYCMAHNIDMIAVVASTSEQIEAWRDISLGEYPIYTAEDTSIKEVVRGMPALVYLNDRRIVWKQTLASVDIDSLTAIDSNTSVANMKVDTFALMIRLCHIFIALTILLSLFSFVPPLYRLVYRSGIGRKKRLKTKNNNKRIELKQEETKSDKQED